MAERLFLSLEQSENLQAKKTPHGHKPKAKPNNKVIVTGIKLFFPHTCLSVCLFSGYWLLRI